MTEYYERASGAPVPIQQKPAAAPTVLTAHIESSAQAVRVMLYVPTVTDPSDVDVQYSALYEGAHMPPREAVAAALHAVARQLLEPEGAGRGRGILSNDLPEGYVWLGDLAGWEVVPDIRDTPPSTGTPLRLELRHRCGWSGRLPEDGITGDGAVYIGNAIVRALAVAETHVCQQHEPSEEQKARAARWQAAAAERDAERITEEQLLTEGQKLFRARRHAEAAPHLAREILGDEAAEQLAARPPRRRLADGPGCTPVSVRVECLGDSCPGCSDPQCWAARADGGDV